jgi:tripartite-type tricarboxylate transporter receptor subunit TctC
MMSKAAIAHPASGIPIAASQRGLVTLTAPATAQNWPVRPVTMVVPFAAGGGTDALGRILSRPLTEQRRQDEWWRAGPQLLPTAKT